MPSALSASNLSILGNDGTEIVLFFPPPPLFYYIHFLSAKDDHLRKRL